MGHSQIFTWEHAGNLSVQVFFALSGWLIGGILLGTDAAHLSRSKRLAAVTRQVGAEVVETVFSEYTAQFLPDRLSAEEQVWDALHQSGARVLGRDTKRPSAARRGILLAETARAAAEYRYGVVAVVARVA